MIMLIMRASVFKLLLLAGTLFSAAAFAQQNDQIINQPVAKGLYELAFSQPHNRLYVASAGALSEVGGEVYLLDGKTLAVKQTLRQPLKPFGMALNALTGVLYTGNTLDGAVTSVDTKTGKILHQQILDGRKRSDTVKPFVVRELAVDPQTNRVYVTGLGKESQLWVLEGGSLKLLNTITGLGNMVTGLAVDSVAKKIYLSNVQGELLVVNGATDRVEKRIRLVESGEHSLLNIALDTAGHRAFITDFKQAQVRVFDTQQEKVIYKIAVPESLAVLFNPGRNELYVTHRKAGTISVIDTNNYAVKRTIKAQALPNSLALSADGNRLYVSVKQPSSRDKPATQPDSVMRIAL